MIVDLEGPAPAPNPTGWDEAEIGEAELIQSAELGPAMQRLAQMIAKETLRAVHRDAFAARLEAVRRAAERVFAADD